MHTSEMPETFRMGKCLCVALAQATVGIIAMLLLLVLASPDRANWCVHTSPDICQLRPDVDCVQEQ